LYCNGPIAVEMMDVPREGEGAYLAVGATPAKAKNGK
jgi:hypothetical protein